jgi:quercetin dioxygenase-like cupin family protein
MREHQAASWVSVQVLEGYLRLEAGEHIADLPAGQMVVLEPGQLHSVEALEEAAFLLSIAFIGHSGTSD